MTNQLTENEFQVTGGMILGALKLQTEGHAHVFIDYMGHFGELEIRVYLGKWSPENEPRIFRYHHRMSMAERGRIGTEFFEFIEQYITIENLAQ